MLPVEAETVGDKIEFVLIQVIEGTALKVTDGLVLSVKTLVLALIEHPFTACVIVTVYVPALETEMEEVDSPVDQLIDSIESLLHAVANEATATNVFEQVIGPSLVTESDGGQVSTTATHELVAVQPFDWVMVTVYIPPSEVAKEESVWPPGLHT